jgi:hypothetical protein
MGSGSLTAETTLTGFTPPGGTYPDSNVLATLLRHGNYDYYNNAAVWDAGITNHALPSSLFYDSKPAYFGSLAWPAIGPDVAGLVDDIPAKARWDAYGLSSDLDDLFISNTYWASPSGAATWANARSEAPLDEAGCCSFATALANAKAGDTVYLRAGTYDRALQPASSGVAGAPITFRNYPGETPIITVLDDAHGRWGLYLRLRNYIRVVGIKFSGCLAFYAIYGSSYNEVTECEFTTSGGFIYSTAIICDTTLGLEWGGTPSNHNWVHHNKFTRYGAITTGGDDLGTVRIGAGYRDTSTNNTFEDNEFSHGGHDLLDVGAPYSVVRRNVFHNEESYFADNGHGTNSPASGYFGNRCIILSNSGWTGYPGIPMHCLIEANRIGHSGTPPDDDGAFGIESAGYHTIIRFNDIYNTAGSGLYLKAQPDPSYYCSDDPDAPDPHGPGNVYKSGSYTRAYNNTLYHCGFGDADISSGFKYGVQVHGIVGATYYPPTGYCRAHPTHGYNFSLDWPWPLSVAFKNNIVYDYSTGEYTFAASSAGQVTYENNYNLNPGFVDPDISDPTSLTLPDLRLTAGSPCIGAGVHLTLASGSGITSTTLVVDDARYFQDGSWGSSLSDMRPDWIAIGTVSNVVEIESIDYDTNTITLATPTTWANNDPVWLYKDSSETVVLTGSAPNIGAH